MIRRGMRRHFLVSYKFRKGEEKADARVIVSVKNKHLISPNDIKQMELEIEGYYDLDSVVITNYQYF
ncbi:hypothetical protein MHB78_00990 [Bacillus sp. FSL K6-0138]|uniref:hypothetical protein n=1 Tax=Bacillus TaxID=1386 RepID=UPI001C21E98F|nr:hypothetical protein [Bacillus glycinifermentans]MBU8787998.1 hypothetical protein [Bacillus glycinifermentans]